MPGASTTPPERDPAREAYLDGYLRALTRRQRAHKAIEHEFAAECARLHAAYRNEARLNPPCQAPEREQNYQATLDEVTGEQESE